MNHDHVIYLYRNPPTREDISGYKYTLCASVVLVLVMDEYDIHYYVATRQQKQTKAATSSITERQHWGENSQPFTTYTHARLNVMNKYRYIFHLNGRFESFLFFLSSLFILKYTLQRANSQSAPFAL